MANGGVEWLPHVISYRAGADLREFEGQWVKLDGNGDVVPIAATTDRGIGVLRLYDGAPTGGTVGIFQGYGIVPLKVSAGGIAPGDLIGVSANGRGVKLTAGTDTTKYIHGVAQESSAAADDIISVAIVVPVAKAA